MTGTIRPLRREDHAGLTALIQEFAAWEKLYVPTPDDTARLVEDALGEARRLDVWVVEAGDGALVGYALFFEKYSSFRARRVLYLEDFFLRPDARGCGLGVALFRAVIEEAARRDAVRLEWEVLDWNVGAQRFYYSMGAERVQDAFVFTLHESKFALALAR